MPVFLDDAYRVITSIIRRFIDKDFSAQQVASYIDGAARALYNDLTGKTYKSWDEVAEEFYSGFYETERGDRSTPGEVGRPLLQRLVQRFANFVSKLPFNITVEEAFNHPKTTYRKLALLLHPDSTQLDPQEASKMFAHLAILYNQIPPEMKQATNWYGLTMTGKKSICEVRRKSISQPM
jgi:hypothetical protein